MPYDPDFLDGAEIPLPTPNQRVIDASFSGADFIEHFRHSLLFNKDRGFAICTAHNIDGDNLLASQVTSRDFEFDPKIQPEETLQVDNDRGYRNNDWDRGHLVRRKSVSWGDEDDAAKAERESDFYSNIAPQHTKLHSAAWGRIEDFMLERVQDTSNRASVFTGPVFTEDDPEIVNRPGELPIQIPAGFWKIIAVRLDGQMRAAGFLVWQRDYDDENPLPFAPVLEQVRLTTIEVLTGLTFPALRLFDPLLFGRDGQARSVAASRSRVRRGFDRLRDIQITANVPMPEIGEEAMNELAPPASSAIFESSDILL